jgi:lantibiotic biosynthesis protein
MYEALDNVLVRAPLLPVDTYGTLAVDPDGAPAQQGWSGIAARTDAALIQRAIAVGSMSLFESLERPPAQWRKPDRLNSKLLRYLIRMSTRPTPFGLFAGVALGSWADQTDLALAGTPRRTRTRPDMEWLYAIVGALEARPQVRRELRFVANREAVLRGDRIFLAERAVLGSSRDGQSVSVRATGPVRAALRAAREPVPYQDLIAQLVDAMPGVEPGLVEGLIEELWRQTILLTDIWPALTVANPARWVSARLAGITAAAASRTSLLAILGLADAFDAEPAEHGVAAYRRMVDQAAALARTAGAASPAAPVQVDMALPLSGHRMSRRVGEQAARAAELLLRITPWPEGIPYLAGYRQAFAARYGAARWVPVLELLDPLAGLGSPLRYAAAGPGVTQQQAADRSQVLQRLALGALADRKIAVELDERTIERLQTWSPDPCRAPASLDIYGFVAARSRQAIDAGDFQFVVGPNIGANSAGRTLGRFVDILGCEGQEGLQIIDRAEAEMAPDRISAELVYQPRQAHSANVLVRQAPRSYEICLGGVCPGVGRDHVIPLDELLIGIRNGRFAAHWTRAQRDVVICSSHMLSSMQASTLGRFLVDMSRDAVPQLTAFDWGAASGYPFLPRVQCMRTVLRTAEWRITGAAGLDELQCNDRNSFHVALAHWRERWMIPRHVYLSVGDNRLLLDLEDQAQAEEIRSELMLGDNSRTVVLSECYPGLDQMWLSGPEGRYVTEFVISLRLRRDQMRHAREAYERSTRQPILYSSPASTMAPAAAKAPAASRLRPPGSEWLYAKIYAPAALQDSLIIHHMEPFAANAIGNRSADGWFFIRYADPEPHLRLRFCGEPGQLMRDLMPALCQWAGSLVAAGHCTRYSLDTYEREVERYGGQKGLSIAEQIFVADSTAVAGLLALREVKRISWDGEILAAITVDDLCTALGQDPANRLRWYTSQAGGLKREISQEYRYRQAELRSVIGSANFRYSQLGGAVLEEVLSARRLAIAPLAQQLMTLAEAGQLANSVDAIYASIVHMHLNRLAFGSASRERRLLALLERTANSLEKAPLRHLLARDASLC